MKGFHNISVTALQNKIAELMGDLVTEREQSLELRNKNRKLQMMNNKLHQEIDELHRVAKSRRKSDD